MTSDEIERMFDSTGLGNKMLADCSEDECKQLVMFVLEAVEIEGEQTIGLHDIIGKELVKAAIEKHGDGWWNEEHEDCEDATNRDWIVEDIWKMAEIFGLQILVTPAGGAYETDGASD